MNLISCCEHPAPIRWLLVGPLGLSVACERCRTSRTRALRTHFEELTWRIAKPWLVRPTASSRGASVATDATTRLVGILLIAFVLTGYGAGTEQFIPIGQSPGVSGKLSIMGQLTVADSRTMRLCLATERGTVCANYSHAMSLYLDRSHRQQPNTVGTWRDLRVGQTVEIYPNHGIKIRIEEAP